MLRTDCPPRPELLAYSLGTLPPQEIEAIADHIDTCETCQSALATLSDPTDALVEQLRQPLPVDEYAREEPCRRAIARVKAFVPALDAAEGIPSPPESEPLPQLGEYLLLAKLGEGGMGAVYRAQHTKLDKLVALKVVRKDRMQDPRVVSRFEREMKAVGRLSHPNIVQAFDAREIDGTHFLAMEYVEGLDLAKLTSATGPLRVADACELVRQAAVGLQHAHEQGLVHRDIKPSNLMLSVVSGQWSVVTDHGQRTTRHGQLTADFGQHAILKILDFGLSLLGVDQPNRPEMTAAGTAMGTADYVSPEQVTDSHSVDIRSDIYSLGCTLYKLLSGRAPFVGPEFKNDVTKMMAHVDKVPPPISLLRTDLPAGLAEVVERMMAKQPDDRYATPGEVATALEPYAVGCDLGRLLNEANGMLGLPAQETPPSASTGKLSGSAHVDTATSARLAPVLRGEGPGVRAGSGRRRLWITLIAAAAALPLLLGVWVIIRDKSGREVGRMQIPEGGSAVLVDERGKPVAGGRPTAEPSKTQPAAKSKSTPAAPANVVERPTPISITLTPEPLDLPAGAPLSQMAIVAQPAAISGLRSWTIETIGHRGVCDIAYSPDGRILATSSADGAVRLWDANDGHFLSAIVAHDAAITGLCWSPDGKMLATSGRDASVRLWDVASGRRLLILKGEAEFCSVAWSPSGRFLAAGSQGEMLHFWEFSATGVASGFRLAVRREGWKPVAPGVKTRAVRAHPGQPVRCVAWSPDGRFLASGSDTLRIWEPETCQMLRVVECYATHKIAWHPAGKILGAAHNTVSLWDTSKGELAAWLPKASRPEIGFAWSPDGQILTTRSEVGDLRMLDVSARKVVREVPAAPNFFYSHATEYSPLNDHFAMVSDHNKVRVCDAQSLETVWTSPGHGHDMPCLAWSGDGTGLATIQYGMPNLRVWDVVLARLRRETVVPGFNHWLAWRPGGYQLAILTPALELRDATTLKQQRASIETGSCPRAPTWSPDGTALAIISTQNDGLGEILDMEAGKVLAKFPASRNAIAYSSDGKLMAVSVGQDIKTCEAKTGEVRETLASAPAEVFSLAWSPDGKTLAAACGDKKVYLLDVAQKRIANGWEGHKAEPWFMRWSSDSGTLVSGSDRDTCVWDMHGGKLLRVIEDDGVGGISPDCRWLASRGQSAIRMRQIDNGQIAQTILSLRDSQYAAVSPDGHFRGSPDVEQEFVYVALTDAGEQITLTPAEFAEKYGWKNDRAKVTAFPEPSRQQPASSGESPQHANQPKPAESNP